MSRYRDMLLGGALGDSLGANVEFLTRDEILRHYGQFGVQTLVPAYGKLGAITDDTQMTLFTAEALIQFHLERTVKGSAPSVLAMVGNAYKRWQTTQSHEKPRQGVFSGSFGGKGLLSVREMHARRAPGNTCMQSISEWPGEVRNISKGCGVVMKTLPVAMFQHALGGTIQETFGLACDIASLTHKHPSAAASAGMLSVIHHRLLDGTPLRDAVAQALEAAQRTGRAEFREATALLERSLRLAERPFVHSTMDMLGQGWTADEALALAAYCALTAPNFKTGTLNAINQSGDSDSVGCMTGQLLAATYGLASETEWLSNLELTAVICGLAADLEAMPAWTLDQKRQKHWQYCSWL